VWRLWVIVGWFVFLLVWNLPAGLSAISGVDMPRLCLAVLEAIPTPTSILLSIAVIVLALTVNFQPRSPY
jgi:hypothetical protein